MSTSSSGPVHHDCAAAGCVGRLSPGAGSVFSQHEFEVVAGRMRLLGHPTRLRLVRDLNDGDGALLDLAVNASDSLGMIRSHLSVLHRSGVVCRTDASGPATFRLVDWADWWLIEQYASRLRVLPSVRGSSRGGRA